MMTISSVRTPYFRMAQFYGDRICYQNQNVTIYLGVATNNMETETKVQEFYQLLVDWVVSTYTAVKE